VTMETLNWIVVQLPAWTAALFTMLGALWSIATALGAVLPGSAGEWCRKTGTDLVTFSAWLRKVLPGGPPASLLLLVALSALPMTGCAGSFEIAKVAGATDRGVTRAQVSYSAGATAAPADPKRCQSLDETHMVWSSLAKAGAALTGGAGLATIPADDQGARIGLAVGAVIVGAFTAAAITVADSSAESWSRECSVP
jgi:hypothetical protein